MAMTNKVILGLNNENRNAIIYKVFDSKSQNWRIFRYNRESVIIKNMLILNMNSRNSSKFDAKHEFAF